MADSDLAAQHSPIVRRYGKAGEASWSHVLNHFALNEGFALIVLVVPDQDASEICRLELSRWLGERGRGLLDLSPADPEALREMASKLLAQPATPDVGCVWVGAATAESDADHFVWRDAWRWGLGTLNQHRNSLREHFDCTVVIAGPPWLLPLFREVAPDLWSVRSIVAWLETDIDLGKPVFPPDSERWNDALHLISGRPVGDLNLALREVDRLRGVAGKERLLAQMLLRAGHAYAASGTYRQAESASREGYDFFKRFDDELGMLGGLILLGSTIALQDRPQEAEILLRQALLQAERVDCPPTASAAVRAMMAKAIGNQNRSDEAEALFKDLLSNDLNFDDEAFRAIVVQWLAEVIENQGRHTEAEGLLRQALALKEKNGADALSRAAVAGRLGRLVLEQHKFEDAETLFRQELNLREQGGDSVYDQALTMSDLGYALASQGRLNDAHQTLAQAQETLAQAQALLDRSDEALQRIESLRSLLEDLQRDLDATQHTLAENGSGAASVPP